MPRLITTGNELLAMLATNIVGRLRKKAGRSRETRIDAAYRAGSCVTSRLLICGVVL